MLYFVDDNYTIYIPNISTFVAWRTLPGRGPVPIVGRGERESIKSSGKKFETAVKEATNLRKRENMILSSKLDKKIGNTEGGIHLSEIYEIEDGSKVIFKPSSGEKHPYAFDMPIEKGDLYKREVVSYELAREMGMDIVPVTVIHRKNNDIGSVQDWINNSESLYESGEAE